MIQAICTAYVERFHLSPTPRISVGVHRTADSVSAPRAFHPPGRISAFRLPPLPATASHCKVLITLGLWLDRSIIIPIACHRHTGSCPVLIADCSRSLSDRTDLEPNNQSGGVPAVVCLVHHGAIANVAYAHHKSNRKVSDEWVFGCQGTSDHSKEGPLTLFVVE